MEEEMPPEEKKRIEENIKDVTIPYHVIQDRDTTFADEERVELLTSIRSSFAYAGCVIPKNIVLEDGNKLGLKDTVWELINREDLTDDEVAAARELAQLLDRKVEHNKKVLEEEDMSDDEAERLYFETCGLLRAAIELRSIGSREKEEEYAKMARDKKLDDAHRLLDFLRQLKE